MVTIPKDLVPIFVEAGWCEARYVTPTRLTGNFVADEVLARFGGLTVGGCGPGLEQATSDIDFYSQTYCDKREALTSWPELRDRLTPIADAHRGHMIVFVDDEDRWFAFTDPDEKLYEIGDSFEKAMYVLLLGMKFGRSIERDT